MIPETETDKFWQMVKRTSGCWLWQRGRTNRGYGKFYSRSLRCQISVHRISWVLHFGKIPEGLYVCHKCDVKHCVRPDHLFLGTHADNMKDAHSKGRLPLVRNNKGANHPHAKLTWQDVMRLRRGEVTPAIVARELGVSKSTARHAKNGKSWRNA